jgi:hypothetical protein
MGTYINRSMEDRNDNAKSGTGVGGGEGGLKAVTVFGHFQFRSLTLYIFKVITLYSVTLAYSFLSSAIKELTRAHSSSYNISL